MWTEDDRQVMGDVYRLLQHHSDPDMSSEFWSAVIDQGAEIVRKHPGSRLAVNMVCAAWLHLEEVAKERMKSNE